MKEFILTPEHLALIGQLRIDGRPEIPQIDEKRPFGGGDFLADVIRLLGWEIPPGKDDVLRDRAIAILKETAIALQIVCLRTGREGGIPLGLYRQRKEGDRLSWELVRGMNPC